VPQLTTAIIEAAISGFEAQKKDTTHRSRNFASCSPAPLQPHLQRRPPKTSTSPSRRKVSAATLKRMKEAQQRRWAAIKGTSGAAAEPETATKEAPRPKEH